MKPEIKNLIEKERVCVLSVVGKDGMPHGAAVHYSHEFEPLKFFIQTYPTLKTKVIQANGGSAKAAMVIGTNEEDFSTLQMHGDVRIVSSPAELEHIYSTHYIKHPDAKKYKSPTTIFLEFTPTWGRYSDFKIDPEMTFEF